MRMANELIRQLSLPDKVSLCSGGTSWSMRSIPEADIPEVVMTDGTYGVRYIKPGEECIDGVEAMAVTELNLDSDSEQFSKYYRATCFPSPSAFACAWDRSLSHRIAAQIGAECRALDVDMLLAPAINIRRDPRGGRGFEYYSEDPFLTAELAGAFVEGLRAKGISACLKHFACNNSEYRRTCMDSRVDECALREIYLYAFESIIKNHSPAAVMSAYNRLNGEHAAQSRRLLTNILREEWGFTGMVVSDWGGITDRLAALRAGCDLEMPCNDAFNREILSAVEKGELTEAEIDQSVLRILSFIEHTISEREKPVDHTSDEAGHRLAVEAAEKSCVLLKNEGGLLPLETEKMRLLAVLGEIAVRPRYQGGGCAVINPTVVSVPLDEIRKRAKCQTCFFNGYGADDIMSETQEAQARDIAASADAVLVFAGLRVRDDTEGSNRQTLAIEPSHLRLIRAAAEINPRTVVVLMNGEAVRTGEFSRNVPAILECFFPGQGGGEAIAKIIFGETNPSGKLTVTFPACEEDLPGYLTFPGAFEEHVYSEGRFVGYRYYDKRGLTPEYPFGFGLSYTQFVYSDLRLVEDSDLVRASFTLKNIGTRTGAETAQLYVRPLSDASLLPIRTLKGFEKKELAPGETHRVEIVCEVFDAFAYYDGNVGKLALRPGRYAVEIGASSRDIHLTGCLRVCGPLSRAPFTPESLHVDLFHEPTAKTRYLRYLYSIGAIRNPAREAEAVASLSNMFWGLHRVLIALNIADPTVRVDLQELNAVLDEINMTLNDKPSTPVRVIVEEDQ